MSNHTASTLIALNAIKPRENNSRRYIDQRTIDGLAESIKQIGVLQPITIRPLGNELYEIICGERRWKAANTAGLKDIPAIIADVDDKTAELMNFVENSQREDVGPAEEAHIARKALDLSGGDKAEAIKALGWTETKFDARLLLLNADVDVLNALIERTIKLGHAELLANLPANTQKGTLKKVIENKVSVSELQAKIDAYALRLDKAYFDTTACAACPRNTTSQGNLFESTVGDGRCLDYECWTKKRNEKLAAMKNELEETYNVVFFDYEKDPAHHTPVIKNEVGAEQFTACRSCANFGCMVSTRVASEGQVFKDECFNLECHKTKKKAYRDANNSNDEKDSNTTTGATAGKSNASKKPAQKNSGKSNAKGDELTVKVTDFRNKLHRTAAATEVVLNPHHLNAMAVACLIMKIGGSADFKAICQQIGVDENTLSSASTLDGLIDRLIPLNDDQMDAVRMQCITSWLNAGDNLSQVKAADVLIKHAGTDLKTYFKVDQTFLDTLTKNGILFILKDSGFDQWFTEQGDDTKAQEKAYKKMLGEKREDLIKAVLKAGIDFTGYLPDYLDVK